MMEWKKAARALRIGSTAKIECCSTDRSAIVSNNDKCLALHCFRCGRREFEFHGERSISEILATRRLLDTFKAKPPYIPSDAVPIEEAPLAAWQWLLKGGITPEEATKHGMRWHDKTHRLLIPVKEAGKLKAVIGRAVYGERPKYLKLSGDNTALYVTDRHPSKVAVVVEDVLSAIAVSRAGVTSIALLGTAINTAHADKIAAGVDTVVGWFDPDPAGDKAWTSLRKRMGLHPVTLSRISTAKDPKLLHRAKIREILHKYKE